MSTNYQPKSYFFTNLSALNAPDVSCSFGPINGSPTTKYRVTSFVKGDAITKIKLFAICDGSLMILPQKDETGNPTGKLNIVIKPSQMNWEPIKIKFFVYRGVEKDDFFDSNWILKHPVVDSPEILTKMWVFFQALNVLPSITGVVFPVEYIFQTNTPDETLLDEHFTNSLINCKAGEHIGYFKGRVGLDIVLDYGDYQLEGQENLFTLDLKYARRDEFIFDITKIHNLPSSSTPTATQIKRYREHVHQFMDAAAFWGSHIDCGEIKLSDGNKKSNVTGISPIVQKYFTKNSLYIYIQENNRSFNYYDQTRKIYGFNTSGELNENNDWPILIKNIASSDPNTINFSFDYLIENIEIKQTERNISTDAVGPNLNLAPFPITMKPEDVNLSGKTSQVSIIFPKSAITGTVPCANFAFFRVRVLQGHPVKNYFNELWVANVKSSLNINATEYELYSCTYDKSRNINLDDTIGETAIIQNKLFFDNGENTAGNTKRRRLYTVVIKNNSNKEIEYNVLNVDNPHSTFIKNVANKQDYFLNLFNRKQDFSIYKGTFTDTTLGSGSSSIVNSLCVFHENSLFKKNSYIFLGITEDEYSLFTVPTGAGNVFFDLQEDFSFISENVRKFKLGFSYENSSGNLNTPVFYPSTDVFVYSMDDLFFFSKEFSDYQKYFNEFAKAKVEFRTIMDRVQDDDNDPSTPPVDLYNFIPTTNIPVTIKNNGEFGFDWLRIGDNGEPAYGNIGVIENGYERNSFNDNDINDTEYKNYQEAYKFLKRQYLSLPTQTVNEQYYIPYLNLFSKSYSENSANNPKPPFEATLRVLIEIGEPLNKLEFDYDNILFIIDKPTLTDKNITAKKESLDMKVKITCLKDFAETKHIKILAYPMGVSDKKQAKLAGIILVNKNNKIQSAKIVLVKVQTNVDNSLPYERGWYTSLEKENLYKSLYQCLLNPNIIEETNYYNLVSNNNFKTGGIYIDGAGLGPFYIKYYQSGLQDFLRNDFISLNTKYIDYFTVFSFDLSPKPNSTGGVVVGNVQDIGIHNVNLFNLRNDLTMGHETLHGYGLYHTHRDGTSVILEPDRKFIYVHAYNPTPPPNILSATDNYMSYNGSIRKTIWKWQMKIVYKNLK